MQVPVNNGYFIVQTGAEKGVGGPGPERVYIDWRVTAIGDVAAVLTPAQAMDLVSAIVRTAAQTTRLKDSTG